MQDGKTMAYMLVDSLQYIISPKIRYAPEIGTYVSYDLAAYDCFERDIVSVVRDVTADRKTALHIVEKLNQNMKYSIQFYFHLNLFPIQDML